MEKKLKTLWSLVLIVCMVLLVGHLIWSANTTVFNDKSVIEQTFTER